MCMNFIIAGILVSANNIDLRIDGSKLEVNNHNIYLSTNIPECNQTDFLYDLYLSLNDDEFNISRTKVICTIEKDELNLLADKFKECGKKVNQ